MKIQSLRAHDVFASLHSRPSGLTAGEVMKRATELGPNLVVRLRREPFYHRFLEAFGHFFALILWIAAALAFVAEWSQPGQGMGVLGGAILGVLVINGGFSLWQERKAERALDALQKLLPSRVRVRRDGVTREVETSAIVPGDVILVEEGDEVPADCRLVEAVGLRINDAAITGESAAVDRDAQPSGVEETPRASNILLAGTAVVKGRGQAVVFAIGMSTELGKIAALSQVTRAVLSPLQKEIVHLSRVLSLLATALGIGFFLAGRALGLPFWDNFIFAIGIIVANVPEGLLPTVTLSLAMGSQRMAKRNVLIRHLPSVETLGAATVICTDKTGTLTRNEMVAQRIYTSGRALPVETADREELLRRNRSLVEGALLCESLKAIERAGTTRLAGDPMELALVELGLSALPDGLEAERLDDLPFDAERKRVATVHRMGGRTVLHVKGALETVLPLCARLERDGAEGPLDAEIRRELTEAQDAMASDGLRVLAFAHRTLEVPFDRATLEAELTFDGLVGLRDPPRPEVPDAIARCREAGIRVIMITGDHAGTAAAIAREIGLLTSATPTVILGERLRQMTDAELTLALDAPELLFARTAPDQKTRIVAALQRKKEVVAMTGDGVNDAPALKAADIGIAMGRSGTDVARGAADLVLTDDNFASIIAAIEEGRAVFANIRKFLTYILTSNVPELVPYLAFVLLRIPLPLTVLQILAVDLGTDMVPALGLGAEPPHAGIMLRPPRPRGERLLDWRLLLRAYLFLGGMEAAAAMAAFFFVLASGGWRYGQVLTASDPFYREATTACLAAIVLTQVANVFACRSETKSVFAFALGGNRLLLLGVGAELALLAFIVYTPWGNAIFGTSPLRASAWLFMLPFPPAMLALEELRKWIRRRLVGARGSGPPRGKLPGEPGHHPHPPRRRADALRLKLGVRFGHQGRARASSEEEPFPPEAAGLRQLHPGGAVEADRGAELVSGHLEVVVELGDVGPDQRRGSLGGRARLTRQLR